VKYGIGVLSTTLSYVVHKWGIFRIPRFDARGRKVSQNYYAGMTDHS
jgi:hypothetical protein